MIDSRLEDITRVLASETGRTPRSLGSGSDNQTRFLSHAYL